jgi:peptidoglycan/LPS O-acetylase OafA/YrhL
VTVNSPLTLPARIPALYGFRAFACLSVFAVHWRQFTDATGTVGLVDLQRAIDNANAPSFFFILSGFLVSLHFWSGRWGGGRPWVRDYVVSRCVRILPAYYACLAAIIVAQGRGFDTAKDRLNVTLHATMLHNLNEETFYRLAPPLWTIAVQMQAYVFMPLVLIVAIRLSSWTHRAALVIGLAVIAYAAHRLSLSPTLEGMSAAWALAQPTVATRSVLAHAPHFLIGILTGLVYVRRAKLGVHDRLDRATWRSEGLVWLAMISIVAILTTPLAESRWFSIPFGRYNLPMVPLLIAWIVLETPRTRLARALFDAAPLRWLGLISFGVYIYHHPVLNAVAKLMDRQGLSITDHAVLYGGVSLLLTIVVSGLSYVLMEAPLMRLVKRMRVARARVSAA